MDRPAHLPAKRDRRVRDGLQGRPLRLGAAVLALLLLWRLLLVAVHLTGSEAAAMRHGFEGGAAGSPTLLRHETGLFGAASCYYIAAERGDVPSLTITVSSRLLPFDSIAVRTGMPIRADACPLDRGLIGHTFR